MDHDTYYLWMVNLYNLAGLLTSSDLWKLKTEKRNNSLSLITKTDKLLYRAHDHIYLKFCLQNSGNTPLSEIVLNLMPSEALKLSQMIPAQQHRSEKDILTVFLPDLPYQGYYSFQLNGSFLTELIKESKNQIKIQLSCKDHPVIETIVDINLES